MDQKQSTNENPEASQPMSEDNAVSEVTEQNEVAMEPATSQTLPDSAEDANELSSKSTVEHGEPEQPQAQTTSGHETITPAAKPKHYLARWIILVIVLALAGAVGYLGFHYYRAQAATKKFNDSAQRINRQERAGLDNYVKTAAIVNEFTAIFNTAVNNQSGDSSFKNNIDSKVTELDKLSSEACRHKTSDLTAEQLTQQAEDSALSLSQQRYLTDMAEVVGDLAQTDYSNAGLCKDGPVFAALYKNFAAEMPGMYDFVQALLGKPLSAQQMDELKAYTNFKLSDETLLKQNLPKSTDSLTKMAELLNDLYLYEQAVQKHDQAASVKYSTEAEKIMTKYGNDDSMNKELDAYGDKQNSKAREASLTEIKAIDSQKSIKTAANLKLDYGLPTFRILDSFVTGYSIKHNDLYPSGKTAGDIVSMDKDLKYLEQKGLMKDVTYTSLGDDNSGFELKVKLLNGKTLDERIDPTSQSA